MINAKRDVSNKAKPCLYLLHLKPLIDIKCNNIKAHIGMMSLEMR